MDRKTKLAELDAKKGAILDQRARAILRANTQAIKRATEDLRRINLQILAVGPKQKEVKE